MRTKVTHVECQKNQSNFNHISFKLSFMPFINEFKMQFKRSSFVQYSDVSWGECDIENYIKQ